MPTIEGPLNIPANYYEAAFVHGLTGSLRQAVVTLGLHYSGSTFTTDANNLIDNWSTNMVTSMADVWTYEKGTMRNAIGTVIDRAEGVVGGTAHTPATPNVTFLLIKSTGQPGRFNRGRMYLPGVSEQDVDAVGNVAGSKITELANNVALFQTAMGVYHFEPYILHRDRSTDGGVTFTSMAPTLVTGISVALMAATQRRRMRR